MSAPRTKIFVGHLPDGCRSEDLQILFSKFGTVTECDVINKYGFVHMRTPEEADAAIRGLNNYNLKGSAISVEPSKSRLHPEPGAPGRARGGGNMSTGFGNRRGGGPPRNGFGPRVTTESIRQFEPTNDFERYFSDRSFGQERLIALPPRATFEQPSAMFTAPTEDFRQRSFPAPVGTRDPYGAQPPSSSSRPEAYDQFMTSPGFIYSRRSPQRTVSFDPIASQTRPYGYYDPVAVNPNQPPTDMSRRPFY